MLAVARWLLSGLRGLLLLMAKRTFAMLLKPRRRPIRKTMAALAATPGIVWASVAPAHDDAKPTVDSPMLIAAEIERGYCTIRSR